MPANNAKEQISVWRRKYVGERTTSTAFRATDVLNGAKVWKDNGQEGLARGAIEALLGAIDRSEALLDSGWGGEFARKQMKSAIDLARTSFDKFAEGEPWALDVIDNLNNR